MRIRGLPAIQLAAALAGFPILVGAQSATGPQDAPATSGPAPAGNAEQGPKLETVVVSGLRYSLEKSIDIKKNAAVVLDSINATELGRFPDDDVADSLAHLPGITLSRTTGGEGEKVSIRGLGPQYNITTLNNRILATDDDARDLAFDVLPSEVISGADVLKSAQASALEGSIGGTVNLRTASPFDNPGLHVGAHAEGNYNQMSHLHGSKFSAFASDTNEAHTLGVLLGLVHSDNKIRTDSLNAYNQNIYGPSYYPFDADSSTPGAVPLTATPCCITFGSIFDEKKRDAISGSLEWRPNETFKLVADGLFTRLRDPQIGYNESFYFPYGVDQNGNPEWSNPVIQNGLVTAVTANTFQPEMVNNTTNRNVDTSMFGLNASWKPSARLTLGLDIYRSTANRPEGGADTFVTAGLVTSQPFAEDILTFTDVPHSLPNLSVAIPPSQLGLSSCPAGSGSATQAGYCSYTALMNSGYLNDNKYWSTHYVGINGYSVHDQVTGFSLDGAFDVSHGIFDRLLFGLNGTRREKQRVDSSNDWNNGSGQYGTLYQTAGCPVQCSPYSFGSQGFDVVSMVSPPNFMQGAGGSYPTVLPRLDANALFAFLRSLDGKPNPFYCPPYPAACNPPYTNFNFADTLPQPNAYNSYRVTEKTLSFYVQTDMQGENWSGNLGVRVVHTQTEASTAVAVPKSVWTNDNTSSTQTWQVVYEPSQPFGARGSYTLALPSANLNYWLLPQTLQLRLAAAETMSRPNLNELAPTSSNNAINGQPQLYYGGTAGLKPIKAWQADISIEWYYRPHSALALALFGKKLRDDIYTAVIPNVDLGTMQYVGGPPGTVPGTPFYWTVQTLANGTESTFTGFELTWQHMLDNGFGIHTQFTRTRTKGYDQYGNYIGAINAAPPTTISVGLIYDKRPFSADINWDYASSYTYACSECTEVPGWPAIADSFAWVTASAHYKFAHGFEVYVEGKNLTNAVARTYLNGNPLLPWAPGQLVGQSESGTGVGYSAYGRSFVAGAAYKF